MEQLIGIHSNMGSSGRFVLRSMQDNNEMPLIDLFVREVLQNSLDAGTGKGVNCKDNIAVDFITGFFNREKLNEELEGSTKLLNKAFPKEEYEYLAIKDCNTVGLNGKIEDREYKENEPLGNFKKLVYEIGEPQENIGSGGSWGLGKTVYFRIGIGLVLYYTQFFDDKGNANSRLAATLVEDRYHIKYQPALKEKIRTGISWWGINKSDNVSIPITDKKEISKILKIFGLSSFKSDESGTIIIIPYINEKELISKNSFTYEDLDGNTQVPHWNLTLKENLKMAVQRWYFPRIRNSDYKYGQYLTVSVCGEQLTPNKFSPIFRILWEMYKIGSIEKELDSESFCKACGIEPKIVPITVTGYFKKNTEIGKFVYSKISSEDANGTQLFQLKPYYYINNNPDNTSSNRPIIPFVRKPGLIINYNADASWINKDLNLSEDEYIIGIFILNSENELKTTYAPNLMLEDYIRSGEKAQHTEWIDQSIDSVSLKIVDNIKKKIKYELINNFNTNKNVELLYSQSSYSHRFSTILPPVNFGKGSAFSSNSITKKKPKKSGGRHKSSKSELVLDYDNVSFTTDSLTLKGQFLPGLDSGTVTVYLTINSDGKETPLEEWLNEDRLEAPFELKEFILSESRRCKYLKSIDKKSFAVEFDATEMTSDVVNVILTLRIYKRDFVPGIKIKETVVINNE